jgi:outer membrane protein OmpA-like peptidoglycan-associated protein
MKAMPMETAFAAMTRLALLGLAPLLLCQCELLDPVLRPSKVIYAQPPRTGLASALDTELKPLAPAITFSRDHFTLTPKQVQALNKQASAWTEAPAKIYVLGFTRRGLPDGYARSLAQRRADAVRQALIDAGIDAAKLHAIGYGHDQPTLSAEDEVRLLVAN